MTEREGKTPSEIAEELIVLCRESYRCNEPLPVARIQEALEQAGDDAPAILEAQIPDPDNDSRIGLLCFVCQLQQVTLELVQYLVELYPKILTPEAYPFPSALTWLPLHHACRNSQHIPLKIVEYLVDQYPGALKMNRLYRPLGWVLQEDDTHPELRLDLLRFIVRKDPGCITALDVHLACRRSKVSFEAIQLLVNARPECLSFEITDNTRRLCSGDGRYGRLLPAHTLFSKNRYASSINNKVELPDTELIKFMLQGNMEAAKYVTGEEGMNLLHMACKRGASLATVSLIVDAYPEACQRTSANGILPLHYYCESGELLDMEVLRYLVDTYSPALQHIGRNGIPLVLAAGERLEVVKFLTDQYTPDHPRTIAKCYHAVARKGTPEVIQYFAKIFPTGFASLFDFGCTILHSACQERFQSQRRLQNLLDIYPESVHMADERRNLPLHHACEVKDNLAWPDAILFILLNNPRAAMTEDRFGQLPLHKFLSKRIHQSASKTASYVVKELLQAYPAAVRIVGRDGILPIHLACKYGHDTSILKLLVDLYPESLRRPARVDGLPIHIAAKEHESLEAIQYLADSYKQALNTYIYGLGLPLHCALRRVQEDDDSSNRECLIPQMNGIRIPLLCSAQIFEYLLGLRYQQEYVPHTVLQDPDLLEKEEIMGFLIRRCKDKNQFGRKDSMGCVPIHYAVSSDVGAEFISYLLEIFPESARVIDKSNSLPLHYALRDKDPSTSVALLLDSYSEGVCIIDEKGNAPLHLACQHGASLAIIKRIVEDYPEGAALADINGCLPLHLACRNGAPVEIVRSLITSHPESLVSMDQSGEYPLHKACRGAQLNLIEYLSDLHPQAIKASSNNGMFPALLLAQSNDKQDHFGQGLTEVGVLWLEGIWRLLRVHPEAFLVSD